MIWKDEAMKTVCWLVAKVDQLFKIPMHSPIISQTITNIY